MINNIINIDLLKHPVNWLVVWTMALILWALAEVISRHPAATTPS